MAWEKVTWPDRNPSGTRRRRRSHSPSMRLVRKTFGLSLRSRIRARWCCSLTKDLHTQVCRRPLSNHAVSSTKLSYWDISQGSGFLCLLWGSLAILWVVVITSHMNCHAKKMSMLRYITIDILHHSVVQLRIMLIRHVNVHDPRCPISPKDVARQ